MNKHQSKRPFQRKIIMMIDDSKEVLKLGQIIFENDGFQVFTAATGKRGLEVLSRIKSPNLILLDMHMKDMDGVIFLEKFEEQFNEEQRAPVVFYSADDTVPKSNAIGFIKKSGNLEKLLSAVHFYVNKNVTRNERIISK